MKPIFKVLYRAEGIRYSDRLLNLPQYKLTQFPRGSLFHSVDYTHLHPDVEAAQPYFTGYSKKILVDHLTHYEALKGPARQITFNINQATRTWRQSHRALWSELEAPYRTEQNPDALIVVNYGYLDKAHIYQKVQLAEYYRWYNLFDTLYRKVNEIAAVSDRHQFLFYPLPKLLQGRAILQKFEKEGEGSIRTVSFFGQGGDASYLFLDLWKWLGVKHRANSLLSHIYPKHYAKVNLIFQGSSGNQVWINLGYLNSWIKGQENATEFNSVTQFDAELIQKLYLRMAMSLNSVVTEPEVLPDEAVEINQSVPVPKVSEEPSAGSVDETSLDTESAALPSDEEENPNAGQSLLRVNLKAGAKTEVAALDKKSDELPVEDLTKLMLDELEKDMEALDRISLVHLKNSGEKMDATGGPAVEITLDSRSVREEVYKTLSAEEALKSRIREDAEANLITASDYRKYEEAIKAYQESPDPYGGKEPRIKAMVIKPEELIITPEESKIVLTSATPDTTMGESTLKTFDKKYIRTVHRKDILQAIDAIQGTGVVIRNHEVEIRHSVLGVYEHHRLEIKPIDGAPSTLQFTLPVVEEDGTFTAGGNKYLLRRQRVDNVIRKIAPQIVSLSTYYGKTFIQTSPKMSSSSLVWLFRQINLQALSGEGLIRDVNPGNAFDNDYTAPYIYNALASEFESMSVGDIKLIFDHKAARKLLNEGQGYPRSLFADGAVFCGVDSKGNYIRVDRDNHFQRFSDKGVEELGDFASLAKLDVEKAPIDFAEMRVFSKYVPVGLILGYYVGFKRLIALLDEPYRVVEGRKNKGLAPNEYAVSFQDVSYIFKTTDRVSTLILSGFMEYEKIIKMFEAKEFDHKEVYLNVLMAKKMSAIYVRELDMMESAFIDPISREILAEMKEPTSFIPLLVRAVELLTTFEHPASQDRSAMRDRGYERFAGTIYKELTQAVRQFRNKNLVGRSKVDMSPFQIWNALMKDNSLKIVEDTNPIQSLKEQEVITFTGTGGRNKDTMTKETRAYHPNDVGILSESTVDSTSVGTIAYLSANPNIKNVRGIAKDEKVFNPTTILSTSALLSPAAMNDNPKRVMFITTQHSHTIGSSGYKQPRLRTGYEFVIGKRTPKLFSSAAEEDGVVLSIAEKGMVVRYASGKEVGLELGRLHGKAEGTVYPHDLVTSLAVGAKFKAGDILSYNTKFFEPDFINPKEVVLKVNDVVRTAFMENNLTHEDSCSISQSLGKRFETEVMKVKSYVVKFQQNLLEVIKLGARVDPKTVLMIIEDEITANTGAFSEDSLATLKRLSNAAPKAGVMGIVEKIEVFYHGDKRDMTASIKKLADKSDQDMAQAAKSVGKPVVSGRVTDEYRVAGSPLELDYAEVKIYISVKAGTGVGDKAVFGHQMKSTIAEVMAEPIHTEAGEIVEATFGYRSVANRGVLSPSIIGTTITLLDVVGKKAVELYEA